MLFGRALQWAQRPGQQPCTIERVVESAMMCIFMLQTDQLAGLRHADLLADASRLGKQPLGVDV